MDGITANDLVFNFRKMRRPASEEPALGGQLDVRALQSLGASPDVIPPSDSASNETVNRALLAILPTVVGAAFGGAEGGAIGAQSASKGLTQLDQTQERERQEARKRAERTEDLSFKERQVRVAERGADARDEANRLKRAEIGLKQGRDLSTAEKEVDKQFAKEYNEYIAKGGYADTEKMLTQLKGARKILNESFGAASGPIVSLAPEFIRKRVPGLSKGVIAEEMVKEVVQRNLRQILGAQFTEQEGTMLMERAYNPAFSEKENIRRIDRLIKQIEDAAKSKEQAVKYYETHGTLKGFKGSLARSPSDFLSDVSQSPDLKIGTVRRGYRYKGGDPSQPDSWEEVSN